MLARVAGGTAHDGDWLIADTQTGGRGRVGREWVSPPGNLYASGIVELRAGDPPPATLALALALAVYETLVIWAGQEALKLKWPNDVLAREEGLNWGKLAGILLERSGSWVVAGVGVNLSHRPQGLDRPVAMLADLNVVPPAPRVVLDAIAEELRQWVAKWRTDLSAIRSAWLARAHAIGTALSATLPDGERIDGLFDGLTEDCALRLRTVSGEARIIHAADVFLI